MTHEEFAEILEQQLARISAVLGVKTEEYATDDQLHNIRMAAHLEGKSLAEAAAGMMVKHTVSIFTMVHDGKPHPEAKWDEKITDHIIWLVLLKAALIEGAKDPLDVDIPTALIAQMDRFRDTVVASDRVITGNGGQPHIPASEILRLAASILENNPPNPGQETLSC